MVALYFAAPLTLAPGPNVAAGKLVNARAVQSDDERLIVNLPLTDVTPELPEQLPDLTFADIVVGVAGPPNVSGVGLNLIFPLTEQCSDPCASTGAAFAHAPVAVTTPAPSVSATTAVSEINRLAM